MRRREQHIILLLQCPQRRRLRCLLPSHSPHTWCVACVQPKGWPMQRSQYQELIELVRPDVNQVVEAVTRHGFADGQQWLATWEAAWQANLDACDPQTGACEIQLT